MKVSTVVDAGNESVVVLVGPGTKLVVVSTVVLAGRVVVQGQAGTVTVVETVQPATVTVCGTGQIPIMEEQKEEALSAAKTPSQVPTVSSGSACRGSYAAAGTAAP